MDTSKVRQIASKVQLVSYYCETCSLLQIELRPRHKISRREEVLHPFADRSLCINELFEVDWVADGGHVKLGIL